MSQTPDRPPKNVKLSEDEIRMRAQSLRTMRRSGARSGDAAVTDRVTDKVGDVTRGLLFRLVALLRLPLTLISGILAVIFFNNQEWTNFIGALGLGLIVAVLVFFLLSRLLIYLDYLSYKSNISR